MEIIIADHTRTDREIEVHAADCGHRERLAKNGYALGDPMEYETRSDVFFDFNSDFYKEGGKDACHHLAFKPCVKDLPNGVWPEEFGIKPSGPRDPKLALIEAAIAAGEAAARHELIEVVDNGEGSTTWTCACSKEGTSKTRKLAIDGHRAHVRRANKA